MDEKFKKKTVTIIYILMVLFLFLFVYAQKHEFTKVTDINLSEYTDKTNSAVYNIEEVADSDYIIISGYGYWKDIHYQAIEYAIALEDQVTKKAFTIPTEVVKRPDLLLENKEQTFEKIGFYGRISKAIGAFGTHYYEICLLANINEGNKYLIHTGQYMGTEPEQ